LRFGFIGEKSPLRETVAMAEFPVNDADADWGFALYPGFSTMGSADFDRCGWFVVERIKKRLTVA